ncbi:MAG: hypothetical protein EOP50_03195 [Sphingobacteriales bacterium]|nr:MAG: hypothetical protein EOP50_03195 [Sphingobacteriales bacterium]
MNAQATTRINPNLDLEQIRKESIELVKKRAWLSAGAAVVPVPFLDSEAYNPARLRPAAPR